MSSSKREHAVNAVADLRARPPMPAAAASLEHYAEDVFSEAAIRRFLSKETAVKLLATISGEAPFDPEIQRGDAFHALVPTAQRRHGGKA